MNIKIFDVAHGFCAYLVDDDGSVMLYDCGHNIDTDFTPTVYLTNANCSRVNWFVVSHFDEDHVADLVNLRETFPIDMLTRNRSITAAQVRALKEATGECTPAMEEMLEMLASYTQEISPVPGFPTIERSFFWNDYGDFLDTNNLSVVMFLHTESLHVVFTGDLERAGWLKLLERKEFRDELKRVNVFIASHHGRDSGYCKEVFDYCKPALVIISDVEPDDDSMASVYAGHASGIQWGGGLRRVLTTHQHGMITLDQRPGQTATVSAAKEPVLI